MIGAGQRDRKVIFQRATVTRSTLGVEKEGPWSDLGDAMARVLYGTGQERRDAAATGSSQAATFRVLANSMTRGVTTKDRISFDNLVWNITGSVPIGRHEIEFTATAGKG